ncbi:MAG TPA: hypothetical protein VK607_02025, partial [Kofleriaceae bacterium]|nr:hypothetical protein [Kofleriaceae bacterium]
PKVFVGRIQPHDWAVVDAGVTALLELSRGGDPDALRRALGELVPEYRSSRPVRPIATSASGSYAKLTDDQAVSELAFRRPRSEFDRPN